MGEKISGAFHKIKGTITGRPGEKVSRTTPLPHLAMSHGIDS